MKRVMDVREREPQMVAITGVAFAQVDAWFGHVRRDLTMDVVYPEVEGKAYPCVLWICGGAWLQMDKSAHLAYLCGLARRGFVVASAQYRTSNEAPFPAPLQDVKAAIRYLRAHARRYRIDERRVGVMGESAGGYLACMAALANDPAYDVGEHLDRSSRVQAACPWYPPTDFRRFPYPDAEACAASPESLMMGKNVMRNEAEALSICPVSLVGEDAPPFLIIHGDRDSTVGHAQGEALHDALDRAGRDVELLTLSGAEHADIRFFQREVWDEIARFFASKL